MVDPTTEDEPGLTATTGFESSPWAPLRQRVFAGLWVGVLTSEMGTWMQTLGAQWLLLMVASLAVLVLVPNFTTALLVLVLAGQSWTTTISTISPQLEEPWLDAVQHLRQQDGRPTAADQRSSKRPWPSPIHPRWQTISCLLKRWLRAAEVCSADL